MAKIAIDLNRCDASPYCPVRRTCPNGAVHSVPGGYTIDPDKCTACGACLMACPMGAVQHNS